jgi:hypothetical protein
MLNGAAPAEKKQKNRGKEMKLRKSYGLTTDTAPYYNKVIL